MRVANLFLLLACVGHCRENLFMTIHCPGSSFVTVRGPNRIEHSVRFEDGSGAEAVISASAPGKHSYVCQEGEYGFSYATSGIEFHVKGGKGYLSHGFTAEESDTVLGDVKCLLERGERTQTTTYRVQAGRTKQIPGELILRSDGESYSCLIHIWSGGRTMDRASFVYQKGEKHQENTGSEEPGTTMPTRKTSTKTTTTTTTVSSAIISKSTTDLDHDKVKEASNAWAKSDTNKPPSTYPEKIPGEEPKGTDKENIYGSDDEDYNINDSASGSGEFTDSDYGNYTTQETEDDDWDKTNKTNTDSNGGGGVGKLETIIIAVAVAGIIIFAFITAGTAVLRNTRENNAGNDVFLGNNPAGGFPPPHTVSHLIPHPDSSREGREGVNDQEDIGDEVGTSGEAGDSLELAPLATPEDTDGQGSGQHGADDDEDDANAEDQDARGQSVAKKKGEKEPPKPGRSYTHLLAQYDFDNDGNDPYGLRKALNQFPKLHSYDVRTNWRGPIRDNKVGQVVMEIERKIAQEAGPEDDGKVAVNKD